MDPTQDQAETRRLMASVQDEIDKIVGEFRREKPEERPADTIGSNRA